MTRVDLERITNALEHQKRAFASATAILSVHEKNKENLIQQIKEKGIDPSKLDETIARLSKELEKDSEALNNIVNKLTEALDEYHK